MKPKKKKKVSKPSQEEYVIAKVWEFSYSGQKCVTIPKSSRIETGEYVSIRKIVIPKIKKEDLIQLKR